MLKITKYWRVALATATTLAFMAAPAHAGPVIGLLGTAITSIGAGASAASVAYGLLAGALSMGVNMLLAKILAPKEKNIGIKQKVESGGDNPLSFIVGEYATAGKLAYVNQGGNDLLNMLTLVISLSELPVSSFSTDIWINGELCTIDTSVQSPSPGDFDTDAPGPGFFRITEYDKRDKDDYEHQYCWVRLYDGTQTAADPYLLDTFGADPDKPWTEEMVGRGCAYAIVVCRYSKEGIWSGIPEFKFVLKGIKLYDPRKDSTAGGSGSQRWRDQSTWTFSENAKVWEFNAIRGIYYDGKWVWGGQSQKVPSLAPPNLDDPDAFRFPLSSWFAAMNHCDENVDLAGDAGTIKRYTVGAEITVDQQPIDIIKETDKSCNGFTYEFGGLFKTWAGPFGTSVFSFTDKNTIISEDQTDSLFRPLQETYNGARATYVKPKAGWVMKEAPPRIFDDLQAEDGGYQLIAEFELPMVTNGNQAQRIQRTVVLDSRREINHVLQLPPEAYILEPFDVITWASDRNEYDNKKFVVTSIEDLPNCNQALSFRELNSNDYDWDTEFELPDSVGTLTPVRPGALALDFTVSPDQVDRPGGGKDKPAIKVEWTWGLKDVDLKWVKYEVRRSSGQPKVIAHGTFFNTEENERTITSAAFRFGQDFQVRLFAQPERPWRRSAWTGWKDVTLVDIDIPDAPTLTRVSDLADDGTLDFFVDVDWTAVAAEVTYSVRVVSGASTRYYKAEENSLRFPATSGKTYVVAVRSIGADGGTKGDWSSTTSITVTKKNTAPTAPTSLSLTADFQKLSLEWNKSPDSDFAFARVYRATTNDFSTATDVRDIRATGWANTGLGNLVTRYYWITFFDRSGNESSKFPVSSTGGISGTTTAITDSDTDGTGPATPTSLAVAQRTNLNGDGKVDVELEITFTGIANKKAGYVIRVEDVAASKFNYFDIKDIGSGAATAHRKIINAISGTNYNISVAAVSGTGVVGSYTSNVNITASKKATAPTTPAGLTATGKFGRIVLRWTKSPDTDYRRTNIYASNSNDFATAALLDVVSGTAFTEGNLGNAVTRYYWITHEDRSGNESAKYPTSSTAGVNATTTTVGDTDTDGTAPGTPTGVTLTQRTNIDEDGKAVLELKVTWTAPAGISAKAGYEVNFNDGTDSWNVKSDDVFVRYPVRSNVLYTVKVRAVSFNGVKGSYSSTATITPSKKATAPTIASGLAAAANHKRVKLTWTLCPDADYKLTRVYRNTVNTFGTATIIGHIEGSTYPDDNVASNTTYFYWVAHVDQSGNVGTASSSASDTTPYITDGDTDPTAIAAPTGLTLTQVTKRDNDGQIKTYVKMTCTAPGGVSAKASYTYQVDNGTDPVFTVKSEDVDARFPAEVGVTYAVKVRAVSFNGTKGTLTSAVNITPVKKANDLPTPTGLAIASNSKRNKIDWTDIDDDTYPDYRNTAIWRNTTGTTPVPGTTAIYKKTKAGYSVDDNLPIGTTYYYWISHRDNSGNFSALAGPVSSAATTVRASELPAGDRLNMVFNPDCDDLTVWGTSSGFTLNTAGVSVNQSRNVLFINANTALLDIFSRPQDLPVEGNVSYFVSAIFGPNNGVSATCDMIVNWYTMDAAGVTTFLSNNFIGTFTGSTYQKIKTNDPIVAPAAARRAIIYVRKNSGPAASLVFMAPIFRKAVDNDYLAPGSVSDDRTDQTAPSAPSAPTLTQLAKDVDEDGKVDIAVKVSWGGVTGAKSYEVTITQGSDVTSTKVKSLNHIFKAKSNKLYSVTVTAFSFNGTPSSPSGATTITPTKKSATPSAPSGFSITPKPKAFKGTWTQPSDADVRRYEWYVNTANNQTGGVGVVKAGNGDHFVYGDELTVGTSYYVFIRSVDTSGNVSAWVGASNNPQTYKAAATADIGTGQVTDVLTGATVGTASAPTVTQVLKDVNGDGVIDMALKLTGSLPSGATSLEFEVDFDASGSHDLQYFRAKGVTTRVGPVIAGKLYSVKVRGIAFNETAGALSSATTITPTAKTTSPSPATGITVFGIGIGWIVTWDMCLEKDYLTSQVAVDTGGTPIALTKTTGNYAYIPWFMATSPAKFGVLHYNNSSPTSSTAVFDTSAKAVGQVPGSLIDLNSGNAALALGDIGTTAFLKNGSGATIAAGSTTTGGNLTYNDTGLTGTVNPTGTWRASGRVVNGQATEFLRVS